MSAVFTKGTLTEKDHAFETFALYRANKALRVGITGRRPRRPYLNREEIGGGQASPVVVRQMQPTPLELLFENAILFDKIVDNGLLMSINPAGKSSRQKMQYIDVTHGRAAYSRDASPATVWHDPIFRPPRWDVETMQAWTNSHNRLKRTDEITQTGA